MNQVQKIIFLLSLVVAILSMVALVSEAGVEARNSIQAGTIELGLQSGHWQAFTGLGNADSGNRSAFVVLPQIGYVFNDEIKAGLMSGAFELLAEPVAGHFYEPFSASLFGFSIVGRYNFLAFGQWMPYYDLGAGVSWTDLAPRIPEQSTPFEFLLETGPGIQYFFSEDNAITASLRLHHISNGGLGDRNTGINAIMVLIGYSFYIPYIH